MLTENALELLEDRTTRFGSPMRWPRNETFTDFNAIGLSKGYPSS